MMNPLEISHLKKEGWTSSVCKHFILHPMFFLFKIWTCYVKVGLVPSGCRERYALCGDGSRRACLLGGFFGLLHHC